MKNVIKLYLANSFYHMYNRGVEKRNIFQEEIDYKMFLSYLKDYLVPPYPEQVRPVRRSNLHEIIRLVTFCLMPNHFHLLVKQLEERAITQFMRSLTNAYTTYFNKKYERVGPLFQGTYKAVLIETEPQLLHTTRYIHLNPTELSDQYRLNLLDYPYSSYAEYLRKSRTSWMHPEEILAFFHSARKTHSKDVFSYQGFVEDYLVDSRDVLRNLALD